MTQLVSSPTLKANPESPQKLSISEISGHNLQKWEQFLGGKSWEVKA